MRSRSPFKMTSMTVALIAALMLWGCDTGPAGTEESASKPVADDNPEQAAEAGDNNEEENKAGDREKTQLSGKLVDGTRVVEVKAKKFAFVPDKIVVAKGQPVRLKVTSTDVMHGIGIPAYGINQKLKPDKTEVIEFTPKETGKHPYRCTVYCGPGHHKMHGTLKVVEKKR